MGFLWNVLRLFCIYFILSIQYSFYGTSPLHSQFVEVAPLKRFPFIVSLNNRTKLNKCKTAAELAPFGGGSLITTEHVLTAAHCLIPYESIDEVVIKIESTNLRTVDDVHEVSWWITYSEYCNIELFNKNGRDVKDETYDIAIIKLETPVRPDFPLPTISHISNEKLHKKLVVMAGWGLIEEDKKPRIMRIGKTIILEPEKCNVNVIDALKEAWKALFLCSDSSLAQIGQGDSGSPVLYDGINRDYPNNIVRIITGTVLREKGAPYPYMDEHISVNFFKEFIESIKKL